MYQIALETGDSGADATHLYRDPKLLGNLYTAPYALFAPEMALVLEDELGVGGYVVGALDTGMFEQILEEAWWPTLRATHPDPADDLVGAIADADSDAWRLIHHPYRAPDWLVKRYPSHLHINLLPRLQGSGNGGRLVQAWIKRSRELGSTGFHLGVSRANERAVRFYLKLGLSSLLPDDGSDGSAVWFGADSARMIPLAA